MSKIIVIIGVTGTQGGSVARTFLELSEWQVRGITRNPSSQAAQTLAAEGVEIVQGDLDDKQSLVRAFQGATVIFSNTDFFTHFFHAMDPSNLSDGRTAREYAYDREVAQGVNIALAAEDPSVIKTLDRFVMSSLSEARKWSGGKHLDLYHFDSKSEMIRLTREKCPGVAAKMSTFQPGHFSRNWQILAGLAPVKQPDGSFVMARSTSPTFEMPHFVAHRDTGVFVKALVDMPPGKDILAVSEYMTLPEWVALWGRIHGVNASYRLVSADELFKGMPEAMKEEIGHSFDYLEEFGLSGGDPDVVDPSKLDYEVPVTSMEEYIKSEDWTSILKPEVQS